MTALLVSIDRLERYDPRRFRHEINGTNATQFFKGALVGILGATGLLKKAAAADAALQVVGVCEDEILTVNATTKIGARSGIFLFANGDTIVSTDRGKVAFVGDDNTVFKANGGADPVAGVIYDVEAAGVWVAVGFPGFTPAIAGVAAGSQFSGT